MKGKPFPHGKTEYKALSYEEQLAYKREANKRSYRKRNPEIKHVLNRTPEEKVLRARLKSENRCTRAKRARIKWDTDLTNLVYSEAHNLRKLRNNLTSTEWHVDHIIPLKGKDVSGLHVWNNFAVIPKVNNLRKGNKNSFHEKWQEGLQA
jgi:5-methylcytosine-specific restriction endonuclease McrA